MTQDLAIIASPALPTVARCREQLDAIGSSGDAAAVLQLIPRPVLDVVIAELEQASAPASAKERQVAILAVIGSFRRSDLEAPDVFVAALMEDLAGYPAVVLSEAARIVRRRHVFFPAIAEIVRAAEEAAEPLRHRHRAARLLLAEHDRRQAAKQVDQQRREREDAAERERAMKEAAAALALEETLQRRFGDDAPSTAEVATAFRLLARAVGPIAAAHWRRALDDGHRGAARVTKLAAAAVWSPEEGRPPAQLVATLSVALERELGLSPGASYLWRPPAPGGEE